MKIKILLALSLFLNVGIINAELLTVNESHFTSQHKVTVPQGAQEAFGIFVKNVGDYWPSDHTWSGDAKNMYMENRAGGCFCELLDNNGSALHMTIGHYAPGKELHLIGGLGPLQSMGISGTMQILFKPAETGTEVTLTYRVNGFTDDLAAFAEVVDGVLGLQLAGYEKFANQIAE